MKTRQIVVTQSRLYPADTISMSTVMTTSVAERLQQQFGFQTSGPQPTAQGPVLALATGAFADGGSTRAVLRLQIGTRHLEFQIEGTSEVADRYFSEVARFLSDMLPNKPDLTKPIHKTENTTSVAELGVAFDALLSPRFEEFLATTTADSLTQAGHKVVLHAVALGIRVSWVPTAEPSLVKLADKTLRLEVRQGTRLEERVFFITSPTDSNTHNRWLSALESTFSDKAPSISAGVIEPSQENQ